MAAGEITTNSKKEGDCCYPPIFRPSRRSFRIRYRITCKPKNYRYHIIEDRWCNNGETFDCRKEFWVPAHLVKQITGFVPSHSHQLVKTMWILLPYVIIHYSHDIDQPPLKSRDNHPNNNYPHSHHSIPNYHSPLLWWLTFPPNQQLPENFYTTAPSSAGTIPERQQQQQQHSPQPSGGGSPLISSQFTRRPFSFESLRYFPEPGESVTDQATRLLGRFRGSQ